MTTSAKALALLFCIHSAAGLQCWSCGDDSCSSVIEETCSSAGSKCRSMSCSGTLGTDDMNRFYKSCVSAYACPPHNGLYSYNAGHDKFTCSVTCCDSDLCNPADTSTPVTPPAGSLQCRACSTFSGQCYEDVVCNALETVCFEGEVEDWDSRVKVSGCGTENVLSSSSVTLPPYKINEPGHLDSSSSGTGTATTTAAPPTTTTTTTTAAPPPPPPPPTTTAPTTAAAADANPLGSVSGGAALNISLVHTFFLVVSVWLLSHRPGLILR